MHSKFFNQLVQHIDQNRSRLWIALVGLYVIPYILVVIGSVLFPSNNFFLVMAMIATSEGLGSFSYMIRKWGQKTKTRSKKPRKRSKKLHNDFDVLYRYIE